MSFSSLSRRQQGLLLTAAGPLIISPDALLIKLVGMPDSQALLWRGLLMALGMLAIVALLFGVSNAGCVLGNHYPRAATYLGRRRQAMACLG